MAFLEDEQAREHFMFHSNMQIVWQIISKTFYMEIIKTCGSLPLSLEILGCYLCDIRDLEIWKGALRELKGGWDIIGGFDNEMLWKTLQISYNRLFKKTSRHVFGFFFFFASFKKNTFCRMY
jgi:hypothetical protein